MKIIIAGDGKLGSMLARQLSAEGHDLTLIDRITDANGNTISNNEPVLHSTVDLPQDLWDSIHSGMRAVVKNHSAFEDYKGVQVAGKTGTAQFVVTKPNHALFIGYAPYEAPEIALAVRVAYGYTSANTATIARDVVHYYFKQQDTSVLIPGHAIQVISGNIRTD